MLAGVALLMVGLGFKIAAAPFHIWTPDVYQGAPSPVTAFMASAGKVAAFAALLRVLVTALPFYRDDWRPVVWVLAVASLVVGSFLAVVQTDVKRMLAYSSISHVGFMLVGVEAAGRTAGEADAGLGVPSTLFYLFAYAIIVIGTFAVVTLVARTRRPGHRPRRLPRPRPAPRPWLAVALTVFLVAQAGVPFTTGFIAKFGVIEAAVDEGSYTLAIIAMVASVVAAFVYLRIMVSAWIADVPEDGEATEARRPAGGHRAGDHRRGRVHARRRHRPRLARRRRPVGDRRPASPADRLPAAGAWVGSGPCPASSSPRWTRPASATCGG